MVDSLQSPKITRSRTKPNLQVTEEQYKDALHALLVAEPPLLDMRNKFGSSISQACEAGDSRATCILGEVVVSTNQQGLQPIGVAEQQDQDCTVQIGA